MEGPQRPAAVGAPTVETCDADRIGSIELVRVVLFNESSSDLRSVSRVGVSAIGSAIPATQLRSRHSASGQNGTGKEQPVAPQSIGGQLTQAKRCKAASFGEVDAA